ncbi:hypothetical protein A3A52_02290 [Candidatus Woesebacteria bacterium RIFCSPLOWO2_01_FULL_39_14]|uniref:Cohesin domain-containing protein n=2 Tax=Candidatus Woeseibacteriota TaxID=1752722 RepID=A0A1F8BDD6_9BACT|nr:MAG: hypothetical protein A3A52_02290 [Candidatus Woesebacteria bacterium RIFCSPLOWO2_01_FULL_39_14]
MLKEKLNKIYKYYLKGKTLSLIGILVIVLSLPVALTLLRQRATYKTQAVVEPVDISFSPSSQTLPPDSTFRIMMNARTNNISFARVVFTFDRTKVNLASEITTTSAMGTVVERTSRTNANSTGRATLVLAVPPGATLPTGTFEFARFNLTRISTTANDTTQLQFTQSDIQVVDTTAEAAPSYTFTNASLTLNPTVSTPTPIPTNAPTNTPTPVPATPTPTPAAGVSIVLNSATGSTCRQVCASADPDRYMECRSVGTDSQASNGNAEIYDQARCITLQGGMTCDARMVDRTQICNGNRTNWTRCRCE